MCQIAFLLALIPWSVFAADIEEIRVSDMDQVICLRADGTAQLSFRGHPNWFEEDERVGKYTAVLDRRTFQRLEAMPGAAGFDDLKTHYLPYSSMIICTTVVRAGKERTLARHDRAIASDPEPPKDLWALEMAVRGIASELKWEPIETGLIVNFGPAKESRHITVREAGSNYVIASLRSSKEQVRIPVSPANYFVEVSTVIDNRHVDRWHVGCLIPDDSYLLIGEGDSYDTMMIRTPNGWWMRVDDDGSGTIGFGPSVRNTVDFKRGTVHIAKVIHDLGNLANNDEMLGYRFLVSRRTKGDRPAPYYSNDSATILPVFAKAADPKQATRRGDGFDRNWTSHPPKLGEPPATDSDANE